MASGPTLSGTAKPLEDPLAYLPCSRITEYQSDQVIYSPDLPCTSLFLLIAGRVKVSRIAEDGDPVLLEIHRTDEFFGHSALVGSPDDSEKAVALESETKLMTWTRNEIEELTLRRPRLAIALLQCFARRCVDYSQRIESLLSEKIERRLVRTLIHFSERFGEKMEDGSLKMLPLTHGLLAQYVGTSREIVTQHMNSFRHRGCLRYSRAGIVLYPDALRKLLYPPD